MSIQIGTWEFSVKRYVRDAKGSDTPHALVRHHDAEAILDFMLQALEEHPEFNNVITSIEELEHDHDEVIIKVSFAKEHMEVPDMFRHLKALLHMAVDLYEDRFPRHLEGFDNVPVRVETRY